MSKPTPQELDYDPFVEGEKEIHLKYLELWMSQSKLFWSRLQTIALLQTGVLAGWYKMKCLGLKNGILGVGIAISFFIILLMRRDGQYLQALKIKTSKEMFPHAGEHPRGQICGIGIVVSLISTNIILLLIQSQS